MSRKTEKVLDPTGRFEKLDDIILARTDITSFAGSGASSDDFIFVGGSNYIVADFLKSRA